MKLYIFLIEISISIYYSSCLLFFFISQSWKRNWVSYNLKVWNSLPCCQTAGKTLTLCLNVVVITRGVAHAWSATSGCTLDESSQFSSVAQCLPCLPEAEQDLAIGWFMPTLRKCTHVFFIFNPLVNIEEEFTLVAQYLQPKCFLGSSSILWVSTMSSFNLASVERFSYILGFWKLPEYKKIAEVLACHVLGSSLLPAICCLKLTPQATPPLIAGLFLSPWCSQAVPRQPG